MLIFRVVYFAHSNVAFHIPMVLHSYYRVFIYADIPIQLYTVMGKQSSAGQLHFGLAKFGSE